MEFARSRFGTIVGLSALIIGVSCSRSPDTLVGIYAIEEAGSLEDFIKVDRQGEKFLFYEKKGDKWSAPTEVKPIGKPDLEELLGGQVEVEVTGLGDNNVALFKVPLGWKFGDFECKTGYWLATMLGPAELHRR